MSRVFFAASLAAVVSFGQACPKGCVLLDWGTGRLECFCPAPEPDKKEKEKEKGEEKKEKEKKEKEKEN